MVEQMFELPDLGEGIAEGELVSWAVEPGDRVEQDQVIAEVETDKALVEVPSPYDGTVTELHAEEGEMVPVDSVIITFDVEDESGEAAETTRADEEELESAVTGAEGDESAGRVFASPSTRSLALELDVDIESVSGSGPGGRVTEADVRAAADSGEGAGEAGGAAGTSGKQASTEEAIAVENKGGERDRTLAMPATRQFAREQGVNINDVRASEEHEGEAFVTPEDVQVHVESGGAADAPAPAEAAAGSEEASSTGGEVPGERVPYRGIRRTIGEQMSRSKFTAPHVSHHDQFDAKELVELRAELAEIAEEDGVNLTYLPFVVKAVTSALKEVPYLNSSLDEEAGEIVLHDEYNIGIAVATDDGLMVPVLKQAEQKGLKQIAAEIEDLAAHARNRKLDREEMQGGTFTITNIGVIGGEFSSPIINYPEAGILAMGPIEKRPWVVDDEVVARETMTLSMSVDHRLVDGAEAAQFSNHVIELLNDPTRILFK